MSRGIRNGRDEERGREGGEKEDREGRREGWKEIGRDYDRDRRTKFIESVTATPTRSDEMISRDVWAL